MFELKALNHIPRLGVQEKIPYLQVFQSPNEEQKLNLLTLFVEIRNTKLLSSFIKIGLTARRLRR